MKTLKLAVLASFVAVNASARVALVSPISPRINPLVGLPSTLPSPITGPLAGRGVTLPSPLMAPNAALAPMSALSAPSATLLVAPAAAAPLAPQASHASALPALLPEIAYALAAADSKKAAALAPAPAAPARAADELRNLFDGSRKPSDIAWEPILPRERQPTPARRHGLPEDELERELGVDPNF
jgi:hypothetical protein